MSLFIPRDSLHEPPCTDGFVQYPSAPPNPKPSCFSAFADHDFQDLTRARAAECLTYDGLGLRFEISGFSVDGLSTAPTL